MKKKVFLMFVMTLAVVSFLFVPVNSSSAKTLKIGSMSPLTGPYASDGTDIKNGALIAIEVFNENGGMPGYDKIQLFPMDTVCDPRQAVATANKLLNLEVVGVIGAYCSSSTIPASTVLNGADIPMITPASTNEKVTDRGLPYMFRMCGRDDDQAPAAVKFMKEGLKAKTVFIIDDKTTYSQGLADGVEKNCKKMGINVLGHDHVNQGDRDFSAILTKAKLKNADVFYMSVQGYSPAAMMVIQAKRLGLKSQILGQDAICHPSFITVGKDAAAGVCLTYGYTDKSTPEYKAFEKRYTKKYGPIGAYATYSFDATTALLKAIKAAGSTNPDKIKAQIMKLDFDGVSKHVKFNAKGDSGSSYIAFKVENGQFVPYWSPAKGFWK